MSIILSVIGFGGSELGGPGPLNSWGVGVGGSTILWFYRRTGYSEKGIQYSKSGCAYCSSLCKEVGSTLSPLRASLLLFNSESTLDFIIARC